MEDKKQLLIEALYNRAMEKNKGYDDYDFTELTSVGVDLFLENNNIKIDLTAEDVMDIVNQVNAMLEEEKKAHSANKSK